MLSSAALYMLTFGILLGFMLLVVTLLLVLSQARQAQLQAQEERLSRNSHLSAATVRRYIPFINPATEKITPWYARTEEVVIATPKYTPGQPPPAALTAPQRAQESLLYADTLAQPPVRTPEFPLSA